MLNNTKLGVWKNFRKISAENTETLEKNIQIEKKLVHQVPLPHASTKDINIGLNDITEIIDCKNTAS